MREGGQSGGSTSMRRAAVGLMGGWLLLLPCAALAAPTGPGEPIDSQATAPGDAAGTPEAEAVDVAPPPAPTADAADSSWLNERRIAAEQSLGRLIEGFDRFFGDSRKLDLESPSTRLQFKTFERTTQERSFDWGTAVAASVHLPRLQEMLGNARLVVLGENTSRGAPPPPTGTRPPEEANPGPPVPPVPTDLSQSRGSAELRFDLYRQPMLVLDTGLGFTFAWPPTPFMRWRLHLRLSLGAGFVLRATEALFVELGGRGPGTSTDVLVERYLGPTVRLRWEGHGLLTWHTRGMEWNTLVGAEWKVHPRTGLSAGLGANGFGTPEPTTDVVRAWVGVRQDLWRDRIFGELEPEVAWPQAPGQARRQVLGITLRLELLIDARPAVVGATE